MPLDYPGVSACIEFSCVFRAERVLRNRFVVSEPQLSFPPTVCECILSYEKLSQPIHWLLRFVVFLRWRDEIKTSVIAAEREIACSCGLRILSTLFLVDETV